MSDVNKLVDMLKASVGPDGSIDLDKLKILADQVGKAMGLDEQTILAAFQKIQEEQDIRMEIGALLTAEDHVPWIENSRSTIDWQYWDRYRKYLLKKGHPNSVVNQIGKVSERILDSAGDPRVTGTWARKGMVIGEVQSGKTANYTAVLAKAVDAGYKVIVVIAGIHNTLRSQTQARIDEGLSGIDSTNALRGRPTRVGVGIHDQCTRVMTSFTNTESDFRREIARQLGINLTTLAGPVVFVIKKNHSTLKNLVDWLRAHNADSQGVISSVPMILIDDEADNASVNTSNQPDRVTRINELIRELLSLFNQRTYIGYTATPFANIFIDHDSEHEGLGEDLFPSDFIHSLDPPSNYVGARHYFSNEEKALKYNEDMESILPLKHKNYTNIDALPKSLKLAIRLFILTRAIRILRGKKQEHNSMLVNVSRFMSVQGYVAREILDQLEEYKLGIENYHKLPQAEALESPILLALKQDWESEYSKAGFDWDAIQNILGEAVSPISVVTVNSASSEGLNYADYTSGRQVIAVGGFSLSRGLTLEGLSISYFYRNSIMYDTLLQMARWFGYRPGYEDLCRVFLTEDGAGWYQHISEASDELRREIRRMEANKLTPEMFGLKVRRHPDTLIVTARNKMRNAEQFTQAITLSETLIETHLLNVKPDVLESNRQNLMNFLKQIDIYRATDQSWYLPKGHYLFREVPYAEVREFLDRFKYNEECMRVKKDPLLAYADSGSQHEIAQWDVAVMSSSLGKTPFDLGSGISVRCRERKIGDAHEKDSSATVGGNFRVGQATDEALGLSQATYDKNIKNNKGRSPSGKDFREYRERPLLIIYPLNLLDKNKKNIIYSKVVAFGISFPEARGRKAQAVEYVVNTVWWKKPMGNDFEDEEQNEQDEML